MKEPDADPPDHVPDELRGVELAAAPVEFPPSAPTRSWDEKSETLEVEGQVQNFSFIPTGSTESEASAERKPSLSPATTDFSSLYIANWNRLFVQVRHFCFGDDSLAEDIVDETFSQGERHLEELMSKTSPYAWLWTVARHLAITRFRRESRRREILREQLHLRASDWPMDSVALHMSVRDIINTLPPRQREVFEYTLREYKPEEIAEIVGISPGAVRSSLAIARKSIKRALGFPEEGAKQ